jgi:hypothetical protein
MIGLTRHPSWCELNRLADGELDAAARRAAVEHVAGCRKCSRDLSLLNEIRTAGRDMRHPSPPRDLLDDVLRDRAAGGRVILPAVPPAPGSRRRLLPAAAAAVLLAGLAGLVSLVLTSEAGAGASELAFEPVRPIPGEQVRFTYRPGTALAGEPALRLRLRVRQADSEPPRRSLGTYAEVILRPDGEGRYAGKYKLPANVVWGAAAVESLDGLEHDDRDGRLWSLRTHTGEGVPLQAALRQEFYVLQKRSWPEAGAALHEMTRLYPDLADGWSLQLVHEQSSQLPDEAAATLAQHREIFRELQARAEPSELTVDEIAAMARYAGALDDEAALALWLSRLEAIAPAHRLVVSYKVASLDGRDVDAYLDRLWSGERARHRAIYLEGFQLATSRGDADAAHRWAVRGLPVEEDHVWKQQMALALVDRDETREQGLQAVRDLLVHLDGTGVRERPLHATPDEQIRESRRLKADVLVRLGEHLLQGGQADSAIREFDLAEQAGLWLPDLYRGRLEAHSMLGDSRAALDDFWRLEVDPIYSRTSVDSLRARLPAPPVPGAAEGRLRAHAELVRRVTAQQDMRRGLPDLDLVPAPGTRVSLESLAANRPTILALWDRRVHYASEDVNAVRRATSLLAGGPGQILWVTPEPPSESLEAFRRSARVTLPAYHDPGSELALTLGEWGSLEFFVIDRAGMIRARTESLMEAVRHVEVLIRGSHDTA